MTKKLSDNTISKTVVDFYTPILYEVRKPFKDNSYEELQRAYKFSEKEIDKYVAKYLKDTKNVNFAIELGILLIPATNFELSLSSIGELVSKKLAEKGIEISAEQAMIIISKIFINQGIKNTSITEEKMIGRS
ncbi:hypothetical protein EII29_00440 [Leptotrichia sp. OH3620_COT-345]|uniref:hypothetical protein n=1 Tax=Leptotrichia sp. OH3620_COT-345 TaxID=2491048 RepID=UPI000F64D0BB|nr:hypothetical protein [Leptotrichia sp. OH3620_COT-345]RRD40954.1 hypothetical protein EII29_00440 [Leptotrichia sp. OH3620_COT-345]